MQLTPSPALRRTPRDEAGVTLIELLVAIVILGIIMVPLSAAMYTYFQTTNATTNRVSESHDAQMAATYWAQDVAAVGVRDWTDQKNNFPLIQSIFTSRGGQNGAKTCLGPGGSTLITQLAWGDPNPQDDSGVIHVSYVSETVAGAKQLHRIECGVDGAPTSDLILVHNLKNAVPSCANLTSSGDAQTVPCTSATVPDIVSLDLLIQAGSASSDYEVTLTGQRRQTT